MMCNIPQKISHRVGTARQLLEAGRCDLAMRVLETLQNDLDLAGCGDCTKIPERRIIKVTKGKMEK